MKRPAVTELKTPSNRQAYAGWAMEHWKSGQYKPLVKDFFAVFSIAVATLAAQRTALDVQSPNKQTFTAFLRAMLDCPSGCGEDPAVVFMLETARLFIEAPAVTLVKAAQKPPADQQRASDALQVFLENPNDNNHLRLSRLLSAYAASHAAKIKQDYVPASERSESIRAYSGGRCSPR